jgi:hypothetical protein
MAPGEDQPSNGRKQLAVKQLHQRLGHYLNELVKDLDRTLASDPT